MGLEINADVSYFAVGFSSESNRESMRDSDIVAFIFEPSGSKVNVQDLFSNLNGRPFLDDSQDYTLLASYIAYGRRQVLFERVYNTQDSNDYTFSADQDGRKISIIWAFNLNGDAELSYHGRINRGSVVTALTYASMIEEEPVVIVPEEEPIEETPEYPFRVIKTAQLGFPVSASSTYSPEHFNYLPNSQSLSTSGSGAWCAKENDSKSWIQITSIFPMKWSGVEIQGRADEDMWITSFSILYSEDGSIWNTVDNQRVFGGNYDRNTILTQWFGQSVTARTIRIVPLTWSGGICLRFDALAAAYN